MNATPLFSVLIASYNNAPFLADCLESVYRQTYEHWEVIAVDDRSADNSPQILGAHAAADRRIRFFSNETNRGCGFTKARCAGLASGEICGFLDSDDALTPDALETSVKAHLDNPGASIVYSRRFHCDEKLAIKDVSEDDTGKMISHLATPLTNHFAAFKKALYQQTAGIDPWMRRAVDQDLYLKLEETGPIVFVPKALYLYRHNSNSISLRENEYKAQAWHIYANSNACKRRNLPLDDYCEVIRIKAGKSKKLLLTLFDLLHGIKNSRKRKKRLREVLGRNSL